VVVGFAEVVDVVVCGCCVRERERKIAVLTFSVVLLVYIVVPTLQYNVRTTTGLIYIARRCILP